METEAGQRIGKTGRSPGLTNALLACFYLRCYDCCMSEAELAAAAVVDGAPGSVSASAPEATNPPKRVRGPRVMACLSVEEERMLDQCRQRRAGERGSDVSRSEMLRVALRHYASGDDGRRARRPAPVAPAPMTSDGIAHRAELRRIGNNINQAVRALNADGNASAAAEITKLYAAEVELAKHRQPPTSPPEPSEDVQP